MKDRTTTIGARIPAATYRLQFNSGFTFRQASGLATYLHDLGVSDCYASPLLTARRGSPHGYDITDHSTLNPEIGSEEEFAEFARCLSRRGMGLILDVVPNHMSIAGSSNRWWNDVLENGPSSPYAQFFDVDWRPPKPDLDGKTLLPMLGDQFGRALENQEITITCRQGAFFANYYETWLPIAPRSYAQILEPALAEMKEAYGEHHPHALELESIITAIGHLPHRHETSSEKIRERQREKEIIKRRIDLLLAECDTARRAVDKSLRDLNGTKGIPESFDLLERLLADQAYRLCFWRVAADEINYRRFFDINELAAIRVEDQQVFAAVHELILNLIERGFVTGLRIDHVDGLFDPVQYLGDLQAACLEARARATASHPAAPHSLTYCAEDRGKPFYIVVEKILSQGELMRPDWPAYGTTGYGFLNQLNGVFVECANEAGMRRLYERFTGGAPNFADLIYECKKLILRVAMSSELHVLARRLDRISEQGRFSRDFTLNSLQYALGEVIACFPVYRSYIRKEQAEVGQEDRRHILVAIGEAKRRNPATSPSVFDFIGNLMLLGDPAGLTCEQRDARRDFILRFQQLTGPVIAKGMEDTAFYRYYALASLNEVGGEPQRFGINVKEFHDLNARRMVERPHGLSATSTHDAKRGEDARARINVLSEIPGKWYRAIRRWRDINRENKARLEDQEVPCSNVEYLLYQTLVGAWPFDQSDADRYADFIRRIQEYIIKAMREAKVHTSWISPNEDYERGTRQFIKTILKPERTNRFLKSFSEFHAPIARAGIYNSLAQTLLKIASPGVPDFYQGAELWDFSLVDPDNRRPVDFAKRREALASLPIEDEEEDETDRANLVNRLISNPCDGLIKLYLTGRALRFRRVRRALFAVGNYLPLASRGKKENHVIAFARILKEQIAVIVTGRFFTRLGDLNRPPVGSEVWGDSSVALDYSQAAGLYREVFTGRLIRAERKGDGADLPLAQVFSHLPVALLEWVKE
ncbi:MAG TPA: malto-oligosyltrehalose synthase [Blastocatellia bacterium]|nr:malto-oligosyltrehalose synthase [Blastocatellia bacterium]